MTDPVLFMQRALELAALGEGYTRPNPLVGCVIVHNNKIIGEGWHRKYGGPHAEVEAIHSVSAKHLLPESTVYVTLEPCSHFGKTPPCADLLIENNVKKVVVCNHDPNPLVSGKGIAKLRAAGIEVETEFLAEKGTVLNRRFFAFFQKQRPYIVLKWAQTADGFIAGPNYETTQISSLLAKKLVHKWRAEEAAILIGTNTAKHDNPKLNVREWQGQNPIRLVIDKELKLPQNLHLFDKTILTIVYNFRKNETLHENLELVRLDSGADFLPQLLTYLYRRQIQSVLVEGGSFLLNELLKHNLWDEARIFRSPKKLVNGISAPDFPLNNLTETIQIAEDTLYLILND